MSGETAGVCRLIVPNAEHERTRIMKPIVLGRMPRTARRPKEAGMLTVEDYSVIRRAHRDGMSIRAIAWAFRHSRPRRAEAPSTVS